LTLFFFKSPPLLSAAQNRIAAFGLASACIAELPLRLWKSLWRKSV
jgi:hypothetical protein